MGIRRLQWKDIAPGAGFHAALGILQTVGDSVIPPHDHDFGEVFLIVSGQGTHFINEIRLPLNVGSLVLIRPADQHTLRARPGEGLHWINVAYPIEAWRDFHTAAGLPPEWNRAPLPPSLVVQGEWFPRCADIFHRALHLYREAVSGTGARTLPQRLDLCRFWAEMAPFFLGTVQSPTATPTLDLPPSTPMWLRAACVALLENPEYLAEGLPRFRQLTGRSAAHLTRTLRAATGQSPTEFIAALRLARAALLLTTTALPVIEIASQCGFENLSYFYRRFREQYTLPPHAYRRAAGSAAAPLK